MLRRDLDMRLMRVLQVLLDECSVSRAATLLGQSQPAVSASLRRLREITGDALLVRSGNSLLPTERGVSLKTLVDRILADIDGIAAAEPPFAPAVSRRRVRIVAANCFGPSFLPPLIARFRAAAPHMELELCPMPEGEALERAMGNGDFDIVLGNWPSPAPSLRFAPLFEADIACMVRPAHPLARARFITLDDYLTREHLSPTPAASAALSPIDGRLMQLDRVRRVAVSVPEFALVPSVLAQTDLMFTTARPVAEHLAALMPFAVFDAPRELGRMRFYMLWHERVHNAPCARWLRGLIRQTANDVHALNDSVFALDISDRI